METRVVQLNKFPDYVVIACRAPLFEVNQFLSLCKFQTFFPNTILPFYLSGFSPIAALRGRPVMASGRNWGRQLLVVFQFTIAVGLIIGVLIVNRQIQFGKDRNRGYDSNHLVMTILQEEVFLVKQMVRLGYVLDEQSFRPGPRADFFLDRHIFILHLYNMIAKPFKIKLGDCNIF